MYQKTYLFGKDRIHSSILYKEENGYGFVTEQNRNHTPGLQIAELNSAFEPYYWLQNQNLTHLSEDESSCFISEIDSDMDTSDSWKYLPLIFKADVPESGNYLVTITFSSQFDLNNAMIFTGRRRLAFLDDMKANERRTITVAVNVTDIIPRGYSNRYTDHSIDVTLLGAGLCLHEIDIQQADIPTIYIAGDSTVTDQSGSYPYSPEQCYNGWGQDLSLYLEPSISVANHAHSGLTTESFREEGHYAIVMDTIRPGDFFFIQFAHNDQKLSHLQYNGGYRDNIIRYIKEVQNKGAHPVIVTPLARNTWKGDGSYNDLLKDFAEECRKIGETYQVPVLDLNRRSTAFILEGGLEDRKRYFFPNDYTHTNDYGGYVMAGFIAKEICETFKKSPYTKIASLVRENHSHFIPPQTIEAVKPPKGYENETATKPLFEDLERPNELATRADALAFVIQAARFFPTNVYNDMYEDVVGHEWYAGTVECAYQNGMIDPALVNNGKLSPLAPITLEEYLSVCISAYKSRKTINSLSPCALDSSCHVWAKEYIRAAFQLGIIDENVNLNQQISRKQAADIASTLNI